MRFHPHSYHNHTPDACTPHTQVLRRSGKLNFADVLSCSTCARRLVCRSAGGWTDDRVCAAGRLRLHVWPVVWRQGFTCIPSHPIFPASSCWVVNVYQRANKNKQHISMYYTVHPIIIRIQYHSYGNLVKASATCVVPLMYVVVMLYFWSRIPIEQVGCYVWWLNLARLMVCGPNKHAPCWYTCKRETFWVRTQLNTIPIRSSNCSFRLATTLRCVLNHIIVVRFFVILH